MIIQERISGAIQKYDYTNNGWVTVAELNDSNVVDASSEQRCCADGVFEFGGVYAATLSLSCVLDTSVFNCFNLRGCRVLLSSYMVQDGGTVEHVPIGTYWVYEAQRDGKLFTLQCRDMVGWLDTSSYNSSVEGVIQNVAGYLPSGVREHAQALMNADPTHLCNAVNRFVLGTAGVPDMVSWENYDKDANGMDVCNSGLFWMVYRESGQGESDCPRDFFKYLAELSGGFVYAYPRAGPPPGGPDSVYQWSHLTLGVFAEPKYNTCPETTDGVWLIHKNEVELNTFDYSEYPCFLREVKASARLANGSQPRGRCYFTGSIDYSSRLPFSIEIEGNPFLDEYAAAGNSLTDVAQNLYRFFNRYETHGFLANQQFSVRPFRCTVHKAKWFHLGQKIRIRHDSGTLNSVITCIKWKLHGGQELSCGGEDSRAMADCVKASKGDKVLKETRNRCNSIESRLS